MYICYHRRYPLVIGTSIPPTTIATPVPTLRRAAFEKLGTLIFDEGDVVVCEAHTYAVVARGVAMLHAVSGNAKSDAYGDGHKSYHDLI